MFVSSDVTQEVITGGNGGLLLRVLYNTDEYQEIINLRKFDFESLFGQVGGLFGLMLDVSIVHIPDILLAMMSTIKKIYDKISNQNVTSIEAQERLRVSTPERVS